MTTIRWTSRFGTFTWAAFAGALLLLFSVGAWALFFVRGFSGLYEGAGAYVWWPFVHLGCILASLLLMGIVINFLDRDPVRARCSAPLFAASLVNVVLLLLSVFFYAQAWSFLAPLTRIGCWIVCAVSIYAAMWIAYATCPVYTPLHWLVNRMVLWIVESRLDLPPSGREIPKTGDESKAGETPAPQAGQAGLLPAEGGLVRRVFTKGLSLYLFGVLPVLGWLFALLRFVPIVGIVVGWLKATRNFETYVKYKKGFLGICPFGHAFDHLLRLLQCRAINAVAAYDEQWTREKWKCLNGVLDGFSPQIERALLESLDSLDRKHEQLALYSTLYRSSRPMIRGHVYSFPWLVDVLQTGVRLGMVIGREQVSLFRSLATDSDSLSAEEMERRKAVRRSFLGFFPSPAESALHSDEKSSLFALYEFIRDVESWAASGDNLDDPLQSGAKFFETRVPWAAIHETFKDLASALPDSVSRDLLDSEWAIYCLEMPLSAIPASSEGVIEPLFRLMALRLLARRAFCLWLLRLGHYSPSLAKDGCYELMERLERSEGGGDGEWPPLFRQRFLLGGAGFRILGDLCLLVSRKGKRLRLSRPENYRVLVSDALDAYVMAGQPEDYENAQGVFASLESLPEGNPPGRRDPVSRSNSENPAGRKRSRAA